MKLNTETSSDEFTATELVGLFGRPVKPSRSHSKAVKRVKTNKYALSVEKAPTSTLLKAVGGRFVAWCHKRDTEILAALLFGSWAIYAWMRLS
jgi:CO/xanthine dehydrogenase Mo-binding subunit